MASFHFNIKARPGDRYGRLVLLEYLGGRSSQYRAPTWLCRCDCGKERPVASARLASGKTRSCGCLGLETSRTNNLQHGDTKRYGYTKEYVAWQAMKARCYYPKHTTYHYYGGRGIIVCDEWRDNFQAFLNYVGRAPSKNHSIDRIDVNGHYCPGNVRWASPSMQANNKRDGITYRYRGQDLSLSELAGKIGEKYATVYWRHRQGWSIERIVGAV